MLDISKSDISFYFAMVQMADGSFSLSTFKQNCHLYQDRYIPYKIITRLSLDPKIKLKIEI